MVKPIDEAKLTAMFGPPEERAARHERMGRALRFASANMPVWRGLYPNQFVVVHDESLVAVAKDFDDLDGVLCEIPVPRNEVLIRHVRTSNAVLMPSNFPVRD
jgi:hypothetical protein